METVYEFFKNNPVFFIATLDGDQPKNRPFGAVAKFDGKLYICTNNTKNVFKQIEKNTNIEIAALNKEGGWFRLEAKAIVDKRAEAKQAMLDQNPNLTKMYKVDDGIFEVLYLADATATFMNDNPKTIKF
ncbi:pyridoxamine 5'-phosphate oxidase family protein [Desulfosporosinus sp. FKB]|uniref:pyridoxamine 5'-phosphate oxidase family protein n=1 Tax=Desulfosporosinus sp. FKB TaxID=1969835 RepID=UPI000B4A2B1B|nr:pyridoxamine 5'-phosphate oxidase family protein [Desulfosporosinus sp. FKB]